MFSPASAKRLKYNSGVKIVWDGNSLVQGAGATVETNAPSWAASYAPLAGSGAITINRGIGGQTIRQMNGLDTGSAADVDSDFDVSKKNILIVWETRNQIWGNGASTAKTWQEVMTETTAYIAARRAAHPWHAVVLLTALPSFGTTAQATSIESANTYMRSNFRVMGADILVDVQHPTSPFKFRGDSALAFQLTQSLWSETSTWTHLNSDGYQIVARLVSNGLRRVRAKA